MQDWLKGKCTEIILRLRIIIIDIQIISNIPNIYYGQCDVLIGLLDYTA